ncbi:MAG TPA: hypothetical protein VG944_24555 [Fimbriimonas sp.]|nr:hypothetical protein [Fimbriimonas sp.]
MDPITSRPDPYAVASGASTKGVTVGYIQQVIDYPVSTATPVIWNSPAKPPVQLKVPPTEVAVTPTGVSTGKVVVGLGIRGIETKVPYVWPTPTSDPIFLNADLNLVSQVMISDSGAIVVTASGGSVPYLYLSYSATPVLLRNPQGAGVGQAPAMAPDGIIVGGSTDATLSGPVFACYWTLTSYSNATALAVPAGATSSIALGVSPNHIICGSYRDASGNEHACVWPTPTSNPVDITNAAGSSAYLGRAENVFSDGSIIAVNFAESNPVSKYYLTQK